MENILVTINIILAIVLIITILLQRSEGGGLGIGGTGDFMSSRSAGNILTKLTSIFAAIFFSTSLLLAVLSSVNESDSIVNEIEDVRISDKIDEINNNNLPDLN